MTSSPQPERLAHPTPVTKKSGRGRRWLRLGLILVTLLLMAGAAPFVWQWWRHQGMRVLGRHDSMVSDLWFSPDGKTLFSLSARHHVNDTKGALKIWDVENGTEQAHLETDGPLTLSPDRKTLAMVGRHANVVQLWETSPLRQVKEIVVGRMAVVALAMSSDGKTMAVAGREVREKEEQDEVIEHLQLWDLTTQRVLKQLEGHEHAVFALAFSPDGKWLASCSEDQSARVWDTSNGAQAAVLASKKQDHLGALGDVAFSPDGKFLAVLGQGPVRIWEVPSWRRVVTLENSGHGWPHRLAFSPDSRLLATSGGYSHLEFLHGGLVQLWEVDGWRRRGNLWRRRNALIWGLAFSPDSTLLGTGGSIDDGTVGLSRVP